MCGYYCSHHLVNLIFWNRYPSCPIVIACQSSRPCHRSRKKKKEPRKLLKQQYFLLSLSETEHIYLHYWAQEEFQIPSILYLYWGKILACQPPFCSTFKVFFIERRLGHMSLQGSLTCSNRCLNWKTRRPEPGFYCSESQQVSLDNAFLFQLHIVL